MMDEDYFFEQQENFTVLEDKLKDVISKCDNKHLVETFDDSRFYGILDVKNATSARHYELEDGLHVYVFFNGETPINYLFSVRQLYQEDYYGKTLVDYKYVGGNALQYTVGGVGNSIPIDGINKYYTSKNISAMGADYRERLGTEVSMSPGFPLNPNIIGNFNMVDCDYSEGTNLVLNRCIKKGDLEGFISVFKFNNGSKTLEKEVKLEELNSILARVNDLHLKAEKEKVDGKKSFLKRLLGKNRDLDRVIDAFSKERGRVL